MWRKRTSCRATRIKTEYDDVPEQAACSHGSCMIDELCCILTLTTSSGVMKSDVSTAPEHAETACSAAFTRTRAGRSSSAAAATFDIVRYCESTFCPVCPTDRLPFAVPLYQHGAACVVWCREAAHASCGFDAAPHSPTLCAKNHSKCSSTGVCERILPFLCAMAAKGGSGVSLAALFGFLLCCAGVYHVSQFAIVANYGADSRPSAHSVHVGTHHHRHHEHHAQQEQAQELEYPHLQPKQHRHRDGHHHSRQRLHHHHDAAADSTSATRQLDEATPTPTTPTPTTPTPTTPTPTTPMPTTLTPAATDDGSCNRTRRPYHVVMTAASGLYQEWQSRIAYYHYKKQKALHPCSDLGGFTRLFNNNNGQPDALMDEIPTVVVKQLGHGSCAECDRGFIVMNRPWGVVQFVESEHFRSRIEEDYIFVIETDHMIMKPPENVATPDRPVGFGFYYMLATDPKLTPVVKKFLDPGIDVNTVDAVGPSPILIHKPLLAKVARPWWDMSQKMQHDRDAQVIFGWVLEMWGYNLAVRNMGIRHTVSKDIQVEPQGEGTDDMDSKFIYHYTFGLTPKPPFAGAPAWRLDKRMYYGAYPSDQLSMPPMCTARSGFIIASMWNEAAQNIPGWRSRHASKGASSASANGGGGGGGESLRSRMLTTLPADKHSGLAALLRGTGPWQWGQIERVFFYARGVLYAPIPSAAAHVKGHVGTWRTEGAGADEVVRVRLCGAEYTLTFADHAQPWRAGFSARSSDGGVAASLDVVTTGSLRDERQMTDRLLDGVADEETRPPDAPGDAPARFLREVAGSGPWFWAGSGPLSFMRGGVLITPWGEGVWGIRREPRGGGETESAPDDVVFADFAGSQHDIRMHHPACIRMSSRRKADGDVVGIDFAGLGGGECAMRP